MIRIGLSTSSVYPQGLDDAFALCSSIGFDGLEIMVTQDPRTQDAATLLALAGATGVRILSIHAPVLPFAQFVWGWGGAIKLRRAVELARAVGAHTVVAHPPFRWQPVYGRRFERLVAELTSEFGVVVAVENMFPLRKYGLELRAYEPGPDPALMAVDAITLDFSHASLAGRDSLEYAMAIGSRLRHVHLTDGSGRNSLVDEHLPPGAGTQPVAEVLQLLAAERWKGSVIAEVHTRSAPSERERRVVLADTLEFARRNIAIGRTRRLPKQKKSGTKKSRD
jgi:sugar phosphate isomerase/epimerase